MPTSRLSKKIILVSGSPRRRELLKNLGFKFTVKKPQVAENIRDKSYLRDIVKVTLDKINSVPCRAGQILIACDTIVVCQNKVLGKPRNPAQAARFLRLLSGRRHTVLSCVAVKTIKQIRHKITATDVYFRRLTNAEIANYTATKVPYDKAGAYGIQSSAGLFVRKIAGCYYNVIGLPVSNLLDMLKKVKA